MHDALEPRPRSEPGAAPEAQQPFPFQQPSRRSRDGHLLTSTASLSAWMRVPYASHSGATFFRSAMVMNMGEDPARCRAEGCMGGPGGGCQAACTVRRRAQIAKQRARTVSRRERTVGTLASGQGLGAGPGATTAWLDGRHSAPCLWPDSHNQPSIPPVGATFFSISSRVRGPTYLRTVFSW